MEQTISSSSNPKFQLWLSLLKSKGIKEQGLFILSGEKLIQEYLREPRLEWVTEIRTEKMAPQQKKVTSFVLPPELFNQLDLVGTHFPLLIVKTPELPSLSATTQPENLEVVVPVGDPNNLGALIRSCVAFGVKKIILTQESAHPFHPKAVKASAGTVLHAPLYTSGPLNTWDQENLWALDSSGQDMTQLKLPQNLRVLVGEEGPGLGSLQHVKKISIPTQTVESLNATVAASLLLWQWRQTRRL